MFKVELYLGHVNKYFPTLSASVTVSATVQCVISAYYRYRSVIGLRQCEQAVRPSGFFECRNEINGKTVMYL